MNSFYGRLKDRVKSGEFMKPGGYELLKSAVESLEKQFQDAGRKEEMGPKFSEVLIRYQNNEVTGTLVEKTTRVDVG